MSKIRYVFLGLFFFMESPMAFSAADDRGLPETEIASINMEKTCTDPEETEVEKVRGTHGLIDENLESMKKSVAEAYGVNNVDCSSEKSPRECLDLLWAASQIPGPKYNRTAIKQITFGGTPLEAHRVRTEEDPDRNKIGKAFLVYYQIIIPPGFSPNGGIDGVNVFVNPYNVEELEKTLDFYSSQEIRDKVMAMKAKERTLRELYGLKVTCAKDIHIDQCFEAQNQAFSSGKIKKYRNNVEIIFANDTYIEKLCRTYYVFVPDPGGEQNQFIIDQSVREEIAVFIQLTGENSLKPDFIVDTLNRALDQLSQ